MIEARKTLIRRSQVPPKTLIATPKLAHSYPIRGYPSLNYLPQDIYLEDSIGKERADSGYLSEARRRFDHRSPGTGPGGRRCLI